MSPWLLRIEMARDMMVDKKLLLSEVRTLGCGGGSDCVVGWNCACVG